MNQMAGNPDREGDQLRLEADELEDELDIGAMGGRTDRTRHACYLQGILVA